MYNFYIVSYNVGSWDWAWDLVRIPVEVDPLKFIENIYGKLDFENDVTLVSDAEFDGHGRMNVGGYSVG